MIVSCGHDERGKYSGGQAGDQTGTEYYIRPFYIPSYGWDCVLRHPDRKVGAMVAKNSAAAAKNERIGYDQYQRLTFYTNLKTHDWDPAKITEACESDCSASTAACIIAAGHRLGMTEISQVSPSCTTWTLKKALIKAGYECLTEKKYLTSDKYLLPGDIILSEAHHVVVNVGTTSAKEGKNEGGKEVKQYAGIVKVSSYLNVRTGPGVRFSTVLLGGIEFRLPKGMVVSIDAEDGGFGRLTGTGYWVSLQYIQR